MNQEAGPRLTPDGLVTGSWMTLRLLRVQRGVPGEHRVGQHCLREGPGSTGEQDQIRSFLQIFHSEDTSRPTIFYHNYQNRIQITFCFSKRQHFKNLLRAYLMIQNSLSKVNQRNQLYLEITLLSAKNQFQMLKSNQIFHFEKSYQVILYESRTVYIGVLSGFLVFKNY